MILNIILITFVSILLMACDAAGYSFLHKFLTSKDDRYKYDSGCNRVVVCAATLALGAYLLQIAGAGILALACLSTCGVVANILMDNIGYRYRELIFDGDVKSWYTRVSHSAQAMALAIPLSLGPVYALLNGGDVTAWATILASLVVARFAVYDIVYNCIQGTGVYYQSKTSFTGSAIIAFQDFIDKLTVKGTGEKIVFVTRIIAIVVPFVVYIIIRLI